MRWKAFAALLVLFAAACGLEGAPNEKGLRAGKYRVQFDIAAGTNVPSVIVGHHDFTFVAVDPPTVEGNFSLLSATLGTQTFYLNAQLSEVVPTLSSWNISWGLTLNGAYRVSVVMNEELGGNFSYPGGCHVLNDNGNDYVGTNCSVVRAD